MLGSRSGTLAATIVPRRATAEPGQRREDLAIDHLEDERQNSRHERDPDDRLIHVGHRGPARDPHAEVKAIDLQRDPDRQRRRADAVNRRPHDAGERRFPVHRDEPQAQRARAATAEPYANGGLLERVHRVEVGLALDRRDGRILGGVDGFAQLARGGQELGRGRLGHVAGRA